MDEFAVPVIDDSSIRQLLQAITSAGADSLTASVQDVLRQAPLTEAALTQLLSQCNWNTSNKTFTTPLTAASKAMLSQHLITILNQITQQRSKEIVDEMMEQAVSDDPMTRGLQLSSANNILDLTSKRSALLTEKSNLEKSGHLNSPKNASYGQRLTQSIDDLGIAIRMTLQQLEIAEDNPLLKARKNYFDLITQAKEVESQHEQLGTEVTAEDTNRLQKQWTIINSQIGEAEKAIFDLLCNPDSKVSDVISKQQEQVMQQQKVLLHQREKVHSKLSNALGVSPLKKKKKPAEPQESADHPPPATEPGISMTPANIQAAIDLCANKKTPHDPEFLTPLMDSEQQLLMMQFNWLQDFVVLQAAAAFSTDGSPKSWKGLTDFSDDDLSQHFPNSHTNFLLVTRDTELTSCVKTANFLYTRLRPKRIDILVDLTHQHNFPQWCDAQLQHASCTPQAFSRLSRQLQDTDGHSRDFFVILHTATSIDQRLEPARFSTRLLSQGRTLDRKPCQLPESPLHSHAVHMSEKDMTQTMLKLGMTGSQCFNIPGPVNLRQQGIQKKIILVNLDAPQCASFTADFKKLDFFALMSMSEFDGSIFPHCHTVLDVFYKKTHKENYAKHLWRNVKQALSDISDPTYLQVTGFNKLRVGLSTESATEQFISGPYVQMKANGLLFKDERQRDWFKGESDTESVSSASSASSSPEGRSDLKVVYDVPIWLQGPALLSFLNENGFLAESAVRSTWNPGRFSTAAWRIKGKFASANQSVMLHDEAKQISISIIPIDEFNNLKRESMANRKKPASAESKKPSYAQTVKQPT